MEHVRHALKAKKLTTGKTVTHPIHVMSLKNWLTMVSVKTVYYLKFNHMMGKVVRTTEAKHIVMVYTMGD